MSLFEISCLRQERKCFRGISTKGPKNSIFFILYMIPELRYIILNYKNKSNKNIEYNKLLNGFNFLFTKLQETFSSLIDNTSIITNKFNKISNSIENGFILYDPFNFLKLFITTFCLDSTNNIKIYYHKIFCLEIITKKMCNNCKYSTTNNQNFINLTIPYYKLPTNISYHNKNTNKKGNQNHDLQTYLKQMLRDKLYKCKKCNKKCMNEKLTINSLPKVLIVKLDRTPNGFETYTELDKPMKNGFVNIPFTMDLNSMVSDINTNNVDCFKDVNDYLKNIKTEHIIYDYNIDKYIIKLKGINNINNENNDISNKLSPLNDDKTDDNNVSILIQNNLTKKNKKRRGSFHIFKRNTKIKSKKQYKRSSFSLNKKNNPDILSKNIDNKPPSLNILNNMDNNSTNNMFNYDLFAIVYYYPESNTLYCNNVPRYGAYIKDTMMEAEWDMDFAENQDHWFQFENDKVRRVFLDEIKTCFGSSNNGNYSQNPLSYIVIYKQRVY